MSTLLISLSISAEHLFQSAIFRLKCLLNAVTCGITTGFVVTHMGSVGH